MGKKSLEIEKKYVITDKNIKEMLKPLQKKNIVQAYISDKPVVRLRKLDDKYLFTLKSRHDIQSDNLLINNELETEISKEEFDNLKKLVNKQFRIIEKNRYYYPLDNGLVAEIDEYFGDLAGFYTVEVEFSSIEECEKFISPKWFGVDVSNDIRFTNASLSKSVELDFIKEYLI